MCLDRADQFILGERLGEILIGADDAATCTIKQPVLGRQHDHRGLGEPGVTLDQRAGLIAIQARHHDVNEYNVRLMVGNLAECLKAVLRRNYGITLAGQQCFRGPADGLTIVNDHDFRRVLVLCGHLTP